MKFISGYSFFTICITLAGFPTTIALAGTSFVTTAAALTIAFSTIVTPGRMVTPAPVGYIPLCKALSY